MVGTRTNGTLIPAADSVSSHIPWQSLSHIQRHTSPNPGSVSSLSSLDEPPPAYWQCEAPSPYPNPSPVSTSHVTWPLSNPVEAHLFRFWIEKAAESLDITSPVAVFKEVVPKLALTNPMLMNAIFMISAQHILRRDPHFPAKPYVYHDRILQALIPYLAEKGRIQDEATLVAAMLLNTFEEFNGASQHCARCEDMLTNAQRARKARLISRRTSYFVAPRAGSWIYPVQ